MKSAQWCKICLLTLLTGTVRLVTAAPVLAQSIIEATGVNGTGTTVTQDDNQFDIRGGSLSRDGTNLFHSFQEFGIDSDQVANFLATPELRNILGRVIGENPSIIDGLIQVTGGTANLYLMNPAGIVFGANAQLNVPANFTATTATGIGFGNDWFNALGDNNYQNLVGDPSQFAFDLSQRGIIINAGELAVAPGRDLALLGGQVVNTGTLTASGGTITIAAVPNSRLVKISQPGQVLSFEVELPRNNEGLALPTNPLDLATLLTGSGNTVETGVEVTPSAEIQTDSGGIIPNQVGVAIASGTVESGTGHISIIGRGGTEENTTSGISGIHIIDDSRVETIGEGTITLNGTGGNGGNFSPDILGNRGISIKNATVSSQDGIIHLIGTGGSGDNGLHYGVSIGSQGGIVQSTGTGTIIIEGTGGNGGEGTLHGSQGIKVDLGGLVSTREGDIQFIGEGGIGPDQFNHGVELFRGSIVEVTGKGNITIEGTAGAGITENHGIRIQEIDPNQSNLSRITARDGAITLIGVGKGTGDSNYGIDLRGGGVETTADGHLTLEGIGANGAAGINVQDGFIQASGTGESTTTLIADEIRVVDTSDIPQTPQIQGTGTVVLSPLEPTVDITVGDTTNSNSNTWNLDTEKLNIFQDGFEQLVIGGEDNQGKITLADDITFKIPVILRSLVGSGAIDTTGFTLTGTQDATITLQANQSIKTGTIINPGRAITLTSNGSIDTRSGILDSHDQTNNGGAISLSAVQDITTGDIDASSGGNGQGATITLTSRDGEIITNDLNSSGFSGGDILIDAATAITTGKINSSGTISNGGNVTLDPIGDIQVTWINAQGGNSGQGGQVDSTAGQFFRATGTFIDQNGINASISTAGGLGGDSITLRHGGDGVIPFIVGDGITNGTRGTITNGDFTISPTQSFLFTQKVGNIQIISVDSPPIPVTPPTPVTESPIPVTPPILPPEFITSETNPPINLVNLIKPVTEAPFYTDEDELEELPLIEIDAQVAQWEESLTRDYETYLELKDISILTLADARETLHRIEQATGAKPALIYAVFVPTTIASQDSKSSAQESPSRNSDQLEIILVTAKGQLIRHPIPGATREKVMDTADKLRRTVTDTHIPRPYQRYAQQFYQWLIAPLETELKTQEINNLAFIMDQGLRSLPLAVLHDGDKFIIEHYSIGFMPSLSLTDTRYRDVRDLKVLAMGASKFTDQNPLPAVPTELSAIATQLWQGESFLNETFTAANLKRARASQPFGIIHLATHGEFKSGQPSSSYIQFWDRKLRLSDIRELGLHDPSAELMVLSACRTALGDEEAELGFTGLAVQAGVKSALGSLWYVSDEGTLGLMTGFYEQLQQSPLKAEALRQAQLAMIRGQVRLEEGYLITPNHRIALPPELANLREKELTHPYYWSAFTLVGSPW
ncbi:CHAT domain-containing protein [Coleofasciculus sp. F4-SAH-05]|uniref:CHAT domain-containing protein n=1 Tax=Coleofasciculus sp. F4-SAH-05 TaxID=3069525 RepID=UPI00330213E3